jgi:hypothetical protein
MKTDSLYTKEQIENDIWEYEGVKVKLGTPDTMRFTVKYSRYCFEPLTGLDTVDDLKKRISDYVNMHGFVFS